MDSNKTTLANRLKHSIVAFETALQNICRDDAATPVGPDFLVNALLDLLSSRCQRPGQRRQLGETLFGALNRRGPQVVALDGGQQTVAFHRRGDVVEVQVDDRVLTQLPRDDAIRLATLLHGSPALAETHAA